MTLAYAVINKDICIREKSSSGGVFTLVAEYVINKGGVVFGAAFNDENNVEHICVTEKEALDKLRGTKYVQSNLGTSYKEAKALLDEGKSVLFTGTPCQVGGLKSYLGKDYDNLYCQDIVCHGIPLPSVWEKYKAYREKMAGAKIKEISFRNKSKGWKRYSVQFVFENGKIYTERASEDLYMRAYLSDLCLRESCYDCKFKLLERQADITLADFWGVENIASDMDDDKGTSLVLVHSDKGKKILDAILDKAKVQESDLQKAVAFNKAAIVSANKPDKRESFLKDIESISFDKVVNKYVVKKSFIKKIFRKIKRLLKLK